jgi:chemotaxis protein MotB
MRNSKLSQEEHGNEESWLLPYSDLMTLLLAVFIVLFASSQIDSSKAEALSKAFQTVLGISSGTETTERGDGILPQASGIIVPDNIEPKSSDNETDASLKEQQDFATYFKETEALYEVRDKLESHIAELDMANDISVFVDERGVIVSLNNSIMFDSGRADLKPDIEQMLMQIGILINAYDNYIRVEGHTDNVPVNTEHFPSNWELSTARASRVVRFLAEECGILPVRLSAVGYGEYKPVDSNDTTEGRAFNRRVDIILLNSKYDDLEIVTFMVP